MDKICKIVNKEFSYVMYVDGTKLLINDVEYFKNHYLECGYTVVLDLEHPEIENRTPITLTPTSDRWIKSGIHFTIIITALTNIKSIFLSDYQVDNMYRVKVRYENEVIVFPFPTPAEAEAFRDEILAKIDRL